MRILYQAGVDLSLPQGNAVHIRRLVQGLEARGEQVRLLTPRSSRPLDWRGPSAGWIRTGALPLPRLRHLTREWRLARLMRREAERLPADIRLIRQELFCFSPLLLPGTLPAASGQQAGAAGGQAAGGSRRKGKAAPLVLEIHASHGDLTGKDGGVLRARAARILEGAVLRRADAVVAVTEPLASTLIERHGLDPGRVHVIPNGARIPPNLGPGTAEVRRALGAGPDDFVAAFAGNLNQVQDLETVLAAMGALPDLPVRLWIAGEGSERQVLERQARDLQLGGRVRFLGGLPEEEAARMVQAAQLAVIPYKRDRYESLGGEGEALKLLQGMACDRPLLVSQARGLDLVEKLGAGEQVREAGGATVIGAGAVAGARDREQTRPAGQVAGAGAWAEAMRAWFLRWEQAGKPLQGWPWPEGGGPGRGYVEGSRTWDHCAESWIALFRKLIESGR